MTKALLLTFSILLFLPNLFTIDIFPFAKYNNREKYNPKLLYINTIKKLEEHIDSIAAKKKLSKDSFDYVKTITETITYRFYHGFSHFLLNENWMAAVTGKLIKEDHACKVQPEAIIKHSYAACSQQEIVMMSILRKNRIPYRAVLFPHHYAIEVFVENKWFYFDPNRDPEITKDQRMETSWNHHSDTLKQYYDTILFKDLNYIFGVGLTAINSPVNEIPAPNARLFQATTKILSKTLWILPLLFFFFYPAISFRSLKKSHNKL